MGWDGKGTWRKMRVDRIRRVLNRDVISVSFQVDPPFLAPDPEAWTIGTH